MFVNNQIDANFQCGKTKLSYITNFCLSQHFKWIFLKKVNNGSGFVTIFDESQNSCEEIKQIDSRIRI